MLSAKDKITTFVVVIFLFIKKGFEQGGRKPKAFEKKQSGGLFLPTVATSKARRERRQPRRNPLLSAKDKITTFVVVIFLFIKRDSNKEGESQRLSEENSPVDCFCRRWQRAKRGERGGSLGKISCFLSKLPPRRTVQSRKSYRFCDRTFLHYKI